MRQNALCEGGRAKAQNVYMDQDELAQLSLQIERSIEMRQSLRARLATGEAVDLVAVWEEIEKLDHEIARTLRKRPIE